MAVRAARTNDVWRSLYKEDKRPVESIALVYQDIADGPDTAISLKAPISLLCGENGVGKSRALRAILQATGGELNRSDFRPASGPPVPTVRSVSAVIRKLNADNLPDAPSELNSIDSVSASLRNDAGDCLVYWFDPTIQIPYLIHLLRHDASLPDLWEGVTPRKLTAEELEDVSALVGRLYSAVEIFEIADYSDHEVVPYFRVTCNGETYGAEDMGLGELSLLFFYWMLARIEFGSVLLLEEPETFVAPKSQRGLMDFLALKSLEQKLFVVVASHSGSIAERVPRTHIDFVSRHGKAVNLIHQPPRSILVDRLGIVSPRMLLLLVEDQGAAFFLRGLLESGNSRYSAHCGIYVAGSDGEILIALRTIKPQGKRKIVVVGVFDGDQRNKLPRDLHWPVMCLPGDVAPELYAMNFIRQNREHLSAAISRPADLIDAGLAAMEGSEHHDWMAGFCEFLNISQEELYGRIACELANRESRVVEQFVFELERLAGQMN